MLGDAPFGMYRGDGADVPAALVHTAAVFAQCMLQQARRRERGGLRGQADGITRLVNRISVL